MSIPKKHILNKAVLFLISGLVLASSSGFLVARALATGGILDTKTVTVNLAKGLQGPQGDRGPVGPVGPKGEQGERGPAGMVCPTGFTAGYLVINHPGGQVTVFTCLKD